MEFGDAPLETLRKRGPKLEVGSGWVNGQKDRATRVIEVVGIALRPDESVTRYVIYNHIASRGADGVGRFVPYIQVTSN